MKVWAFAWSREALVSPSLAPALTQVVGPQGDNIHLPNVYTDDVSMWSLVLLLNYTVLPSPTHVLSVLHRSPGQRPLRVYGRICDQDQEQHSFFLATELAKQSNGFTVCEQSADSVAEDQFRKNDNNWLGSKMAPVSPWPQRMLGGLMKSFCGRGCLRKNSFISEPVCTPPR